MGKVIRLRDATSRGGRPGRDAIAALPECGLSPFLTSVAAVAFDVGLANQALPGFLARAAGTAGDGLDAVRAATAGAWLASECAPTWLRAAGRPDDAGALAAAGARLGAVGAPELAAARAIVAALRAQVREEARVGRATASAGGLVLGASAALWAGVADRYSGRPGPLWFELVKHAWTASWMSARLVAARDPDVPEAVRATVEARAWEAVLSLARPDGASPVATRGRPRGGWPDADWRPDAG